MLKIKKVTINGFGPYIEQTLNFDDRNGVNIIWGDNGVGKTTFINALKFGFYGEIPNYGNEEKSIVNIVNQHNKKDSNFNFNVTIEFQAETDYYSLTRYADVINKDLEPEGLSDYNIGLHLQKNSNLLSAREAKINLDAIMPENTSRFFIFDGELLEKYTHLSEDSQQSLKLKDSIEQILGLPILTNGKRHVDNLKQNITDELLKLHQKNTLNQKNYKDLEKEKSRLSRLEKEKNKINEDNLKYEQEYKDISLEKYEISDVAKIKEYEELSEKLKKIKKEISDVQIKIKESINNQWRGLTSKRLKSHKMAAEKIIKNYESKKLKHDGQKRMKDLYQVSISKRVCETCSKTLDNSDIIWLSEKIETMDLPSITNEEKENYEISKEAIRTIDEYINKFILNPEILNIYSERLDELQVSKGSTKSKMSRLQKEIDDFDNQRAKNVILRDREDIVIKKIASAETALSGINEEMQKCKEKISKLEELIKEDIDDKKLKTFQEKEKILKDFSDLLEEGIEVFRKELKERVQEDASNLFKKFSNQKEFVELKINENYGLDIVHVSGVIVPIKSSGFSHIVSLCLIGALHKNAPIQGPVFIDSPSGRLDEKHKNNLINIITELSDQVVLLLYHNELDEQLIRKNLGTSLLNEYILEQEDAFKVHLNER